MAPQATLFRHGAWSCDLSVQERAGQQGVLFLGMKMDCPIYYICFHISSRIRIWIRIVSTMSDKIRLNIDIINIRFKYSDTDTISDVEYLSKRIRSQIQSKISIPFSSLALSSSLARTLAKKTSADQARAQASSYLSFLPILWHTRAADPVHRPAASSLSSSISLTTTPQPCGRPLPQLRWCDAAGRRSWGCEWRLGPCLVPQKKKISWHCSTLVYLW